jgi:hypothetical protein
VRHGSIIKALTREIVHLFHLVKIVDVMVYDGNIYSSLQHYFGTLELTGNYDKKGTLSLLIYCFIHGAILNGPFEEFLEDQDIVILNKLLRCLSKNNCLIQLPISRERIGKPNRYYISGNYRETETDYLRSSQEEQLRLTESDT